MINFTPAKFMATMAKCLVVAALLVTAVACNTKGKRQNEKLISEAMQIIEDNPKQAASLLLQVNVGLLNNSDYNYYILLQVNAWNWKGESVNLSDSVVCKARDYFIKNNNAAKAAFACYMAGKIYLLKGMHEQSISNLQQADEWAAKAGYKIACVPYTAIPYNMAWQYCMDKKYDDALTYVNKALQHANPQNKYTRQLYALELKGAIFRHTNKPDSAQLYYNQALSIANQHKDTKSINRLGYNIAVLFYDSKDYTVAEQQFRAAIAQTPINDSITAGALYLGLANVYLATEKIDSAYTNIYIAKNLLENTNDLNVNKFLYEDLATIEQKKGNTAQAQQYQQIYEKLKAGQNVQESAQIAALKQKIEQEQEEKIATVLAMSNQTHQLSQKQGRTLSLLVWAVALTALIVAIILFKVLKADKKIVAISKEMKIFGLASIVRHAWLKRETVELINWVKESYLDDEEYIKRSTLVNKISDLLPSRPQWEHINELSIYYEELFNDLSFTFEELDDNEFRLLCILCVDIMVDPKEIAHFLRLTDKDFAQIKASMNAKLKGHRLSASRLIADAKKYKKNFFEGKPMEYD